MGHFIKPFLSSVLIFIMFPGLIHAADFNIKLRKMGINDLKQQLMPAVEQNIIYLKGLLHCLERGKTVDSCVNEYSLAVTEEVKKSADSSLKQERNARIKQTIETKIKEKNIQQEQLVAELKKLLAEADEIKQCLYQGQTANELKNCIIKP